MALLGSSINIPQSSDLTAAFQNYGGKGIKSIGGVYGSANDQATADAIARGQSGQGSYNADRLKTQQGLDVGGLESALGGTLADTVYQNSLGERGYNQQSGLATMIGNLNRPSTLEQVFQGIGVAGKVGGGLYGMYSGNNGQAPIDPSYSSTPAPLSLVPNGYGYNYPNPNYAFGGY